MKHFRTSLAAGSEPYVIEAEEPELFFPEINTPCQNPKAPGGQCHFNAVALEPRRCLYWTKLTG